MMTFFKEEATLVQNNVTAGTRMFLFQKGEVAGLLDWPLKSIDDYVRFSEVMRTNGFYCIQESTRGNWNLEIWESRNRAVDYQFMVAIDAGNVCYEVFCPNLFDLAECLKVLAPLVGGVKAGDGN